MTPPLEKARKCGHLRFTKNILNARDSVVGNSTHLISLSSRTQCSGDKMHFHRESCFFDRKMNAPTIKAFWLAIITNFSHVRDKEPPALKNTEHARLLLRSLCLVLSLSARGAACRPLQFLAMSIPCLASPPTRQRKRPAQSSGGARATKIDVAALSARSPARYPFRL